MAGSSARNKGKRGEREVANLLNKRLGFEAFKRNIMQSRQGGCDIDTELPVAIEVKRQQTLQLGRWIKQAREQGRASNKTPVLMYRRNNEDWSILVDMTVDEFVEYLNWLKDTNLGTPAEKAPSLA
nr:MAG: hypothetical protein DIU57_04375 [Pseudomonadota bacterium]